MARMNRATVVRMMCCVTLCVTPATLPAQEGVEESDILEVLENAKPAPNPQGPTYSTLDTASARQRGVVQYDLRTGESTILPAGDDKAVGHRSAPPLVPDGGAFGMVIEGDGSDMKAAITPTPPTEVFNTTAFPWNTVYKMAMRFNTGGSDYWYVCSAWAAGEFHAVTAGHCIYNWDPNDDGDTSDKMWATEVILWPAQTDRVEPTADSWNAPDKPYGPVSGLYMRTYTGWTVDHNFDHDWAVITLDRRIGQRTGWMGRETSVASSLNFSGYPKEQPYVPADTHVQWAGYDTGNVSGSDTYRIYLDAYTYGGHSGGPAWRYDSSTGDRYVEGINSTSDRVGSAAETRINSEKFDHIDSFISEDEASMPPLSKPELTEYYLDGSTNKSFTPTGLGRGDTLSVDFNVLNVGWVSSGTVTFDFYASSNDNVSENDYFIGTTTRPSIGAWSYGHYSTDLTVPATIPSGDYYVGWIVSGATPEYGGDLVCTNNPCSNCAVISDTQLLTVQDCDLDSFEPDETSGTATLLESGSPQNHSICSIGDEDWYRFTLGYPSDVVLATSGPTGDTRMWLYNEGLTTIEFDDDGGAGLFSHIDRVCGADELPAGTYYINVDDFGDNNVIADYDMSLTSSPCASGPIVEAGYTIDDDANGNSVGDGDGIAECGEVIELFLNLHNQNLVYPAGDVYASLSTTDPFFGGFLFNSVSAYGDIGPGAAVQNSDDFDIEIDAVTPDGHTLAFDIDVSSVSGGPWADTVSIPIVCESLIFADGFETGNASVWSKTVP